MITTLRKGTAVVDAGTGARLGRVHAVYLDLDGREVAGFALRRGRIFWRKVPGLVDLTRVRRFDPDAVVVAGRAAFGAPGRDPEGMGLVVLDELMRRPVRLKDGAALGRVVAVRFSHDSRRLAGLEVEPEGLPLCRLLLGAEQIVRLGPSAVVVREPSVVAARQPTTPTRRVAHHGHGGQRAA